LKGPCTCRCVYHDATTKSKHTDAHDHDFRHHISYSSYVVLNTAAVYLLNPVRVPVATLIHIYFIYTYIEVITYLQVAAVGSMVKFTCHVANNGTSIWKQYLTSRTTPERINNDQLKVGRDFTPRYNVSINDSTGATVLFISSVKLSDSARFVCSDESSSSSQGQTTTYYHLVVFGAFICCVFRSYLQFMKFHSSINLN
jgi:hypothetical protein